MVFIFLFVIMLSVSAMVVIKSRGKAGTTVPAFAVCIKLALCVTGVYIVLPFGGSDGLAFERVAWEWSRLPLLDIIFSVDVSRSYVISSITAVFYHLMERNVAIPIFINGILGVLIFYFSLVLAEEVWGKGHMNKLFAVIVAMHPVLNVHSAIMLRENYIVFFVVVASIYLARYAYRPRGTTALMFFSYVLLASFFHGGMILYAAGLPLFVLFGSSNIKGVTKFFAGMGFVAVFAVVMTYMDFGKLSDVQEGELSVEYLAEKEAGRREANTAYLVGMAPSSVYDIVWQAPVRSLFLLAKPFPWDVRNAGHALVLLDAMLWWFILFLVWRHRSVIKANPAAFAILLSCLLTIVAFAYGTGNFGTGVRHRTKFLIMGLVLISPFLPRFRVKK